MDAVGCALGAREVRVGTCLLVVVRRSGFVGFLAIEDCCANKEIPGVTEYEYGNVVIGSWKDPWTLSRGSGLAIWLV